MANQPRFNRTYHFNEAIKQSLFKSSFVIRLWTLNSGTQLLSKLKKKKKTLQQINWRGIYRGTAPTEKKKARQLLTFGSPTRTNFWHSNLQNNWVIFRLTHRTFPRKSTTTNSTSKSELQRARKLSPPHENTKNRLHLLASLLRLWIQSVIADILLRKKKCYFPPDSAHFQNQHGSDCNLKQY